MSDQLVIDLKKLTDRDSKTYYGAFPDLPFTIKLSEVIFFIYVSEDGEESLVIRKKEEKK